MSSYIARTKHPITKRWAKAFWIDDYFWEHHYWVKFPIENITEWEILWQNIGCTKCWEVFDPEQYKIITKE